MEKWKIAMLPHMAKCCSRLHDVPAGFTKFRLEVPEIDDLFDAVTTSVGVPNDSAMNQMASAQGQSTCGLYVGPWTLDPGNSLSLLQ